MATSLLRTIIGVLIGLAAIGIIQRIPFSWEYLAGGKLIH